MTDRPEDQTPDFEALAAEYALGLLEDVERSAFEAQLRRDPAAARAVAEWQARFAAIAEAEVDPVAPPPRVAAALEALLFAPASPPASLWDRAAFWRGVSALTGAVAVVAVGFAILPVVEPPGMVEPPTDGAIPPGTILMTHLLPVEGSGLGLAVTRQPDGVLQVRRVAGGPTPGRAQQVWLVLDDERPPISLGLLSDEPLTTLAPDPEVADLFGVGAAVAISDEPEGGSPTGAPTGDILAAGALVAL